MGGTQGINTILLLIKRIKLMWFVHQTKILSGYLSGEVYNKEETSQEAHKETSGDEGEITSTDRLGNPDLGMLTWECFSVPP